MNKPIVYFIQTHENILLAEQLNPKLGLFQNKIDKSAHAYHPRELDA
jgi:hypothetical protein